MTSIVSNQSQFDLQDVMPWSYIYGVQNERHRKEMYELERRIALDDLEWAIGKETLSIQLDSPTMNSTLVLRLYDQIARGIIKREDVIASLEYHLQNTIVNPWDEDFRSCRQCSFVCEEMKAWIMSWLETSWPDQESIDEKLIHFRKEMDECKAHDDHCVHHNGPNIWDLGYEEKVCYKMILTARALLRDRDACIKEWLEEHLQHYL